MEWVETTGRTVEEATEAALDQLGVDETDAELVILAEPRAGLFGRMRGEARVRARVRPTSPRPKRARSRRQGQDARVPKRAPTAAEAKERWARRESTLGRPQGVVRSLGRDGRGIDGVGRSRCNGWRRERRLGWIEEWQSEEPEAGVAGWRPAWERCRSSNFSGRGRPGREQGHGNRCKSTWRNEGAQTARGKRR